MKTKSANTPSKGRFEGLDALRFFAFLAVFTEHMALTAWPGALPDSFSMLCHGFFYRGYLGVCFFFVLSAFLITTLLLREQDRNGTINITRFYLRRILRIWPLYFLILIAGFYLLPSIDPAMGTGNASVLNYIFFLTNFDTIANGLPVNPLLLPLWSLAVEEQFYLIFPWVMKFSSRKSIPFIMILFVLAGMMFRHSYEGQYAAHYITIATHSLSVGIDLGIGVLLAYLVYLAKDHSLLKQGVSTSTSFFIMLIGFALLITPRFDFGPLWISRTVYALFFAFIIWDQSINPKQKFKLSKAKFLGWLGTISYGLYCLHQVVLYMLSRLTVHYSFSMDASWLNYAGLYLVALLTSIAFAALSYYAFEMHFLKLKRRFSS